MILINLINTIFYLAIAYLSIGLYLYVVSKRFFDITAKSFKRIFSSHKDSNFISDKQRLPSEQVNKKVIHFFLLHGTILNFFMLLLLIFYYL
ncbi:DUF3899 domain-containing protein [Gracilibacillus kekensis]